MHLRAESVTLVRPLGQRVIMTRQQRRQRVFMSLTPNASRLWACVASANAAAAGIRSIAVRGPVLCADARSHPPPSVRGAQRNCISQLERQAAMRMQSRGRSGRGGSEKRPLSAATSPRVETPPSVSGDTAALARSTELLRNPTPSDQAATLESELRSLTQSWAAADGAGGAAQDSASLAFLDWLLLDVPPPDGGAAADFSHQARGFDFSSPRLGEALSASPAPPPVSSTLVLKLHDTNPGGMPLELGPSLASLFTPPALSLSSHVRPGCTLLTLDALSLHPPADAQAVQRRLLASPAASFLRAQRWDVCVVDAHRRSTLGTAAAAAATPPRLPRVRPFAAQCSPDSQPSTLRCAGAPDGLVSARLAGAQVRGLVVTRAADGLSIRLPRAQLEGCALFELSAEPALMSEGWPEALPRPVLLCPDVAVVDEVASLALDVALSDADAEGLVRLVGCALAPRAGAPLLDAAARAALRRGWVATLARLLLRLRSALLEADADHLAQAGKVTLLHAAAASGQATAVACLLRIGGSECLFGSPVSVGPGGLTPLHLAALCSDGVVAAAMASHSAPSVLAWFTARASVSPQDAEARGSLPPGVTPSQLAQCAPSKSGLARLNANLVALVAAASERARTPLDAARASLGAGAGEQALLRRAAASLGERDVGWESGDRVDALSHAMLSGALRGRAPNRLLTAAEEARFETDMLRMHRLHVLTILLMILAVEVKIVNMVPPTAEHLALLPAPPWHVAVELYNYASFPVCSYIRLPCTLFMVLLFTLPPLRPAYLRHGNALLVAYTLINFTLCPTLTEYRFRSLYGDIFFPALQGVLFTNIITLLMGLVMPNTRRGSLTILACKFVKMSCSPLAWTYGRRFALTPGGPSTPALLAMILCMFPVTAALRVYQDSFQKRTWLVRNRRRVARELKASS